MVVIDVTMADGGDAIPLCRRVGGVLARSDADLAVLDVAALVDPDVGTVDALARVLLTARRLGRDVRLRHASSALRELLAFAGLDDVARCCGERGGDEEAGPA